jgi:hypothetical protein
VPQIVTQPAKFQLFNTLRAIVNSSIGLPLSIEHPEHPRIAKFKLPTNNDSDGQYL